MGRLLEDNKLNHYNSKDHVHFFSYLFLEPSEAPSSCVVMNRSRHESFVSFKVMTLTVPVGVETKHDFCSTTCMVHCRYRN